MCKADLGLALAQNFNKGCRRARTDLRYEEPQSERCAGLLPQTDATGPPPRHRRDGPLGGRRRREGIGPGRHYLGLRGGRAVGGTYFESLLYNMPSFSPSVPSKLLPSCLICPLMVHSRSHSSALGARPESNNGPKGVRLWRVYGHPRNSSKSVRFAMRYTGDFAVFVWDNSAPFYEVIYLISGTLHI